MARTADPERRYDIIRAALEIIREQGVHRVTMSEIASAVDMKRPTLYWYFKDVGTIFDAALEMLLLDLTAGVQSAMAEHTHPLDILMAYVRGVHRYFDGRESEIVALVQLWAVGSPNAFQTVLERTQQYFAPRRAWLRLILTQGIDDGHVAPCDVDTVLDLISTSVDGMLLHRITRNIELGPLHALLFDTLLEPLRLDPDRTPTP